jgi:hypothetical protein
LLNVLYNLLDVVTWIVHEGTGSGSDEEIYLR